MARKTLKEGMPVTRTRKVKTRVAARVQMQGRRRDVKPIDIEDGGRQSGSESVSGWR